MCGGRRGGIGMNGGLIFGLLELFILSYDHATFRGERGSACNENTKWENYSASPYHRKRIHNNWWIPHGHLETGRFLLMAVRRPRVKRLRNMKPTVKCITPVVRCCTCKLVLAGRCVRTRTITKKIAME